MDRILLLMGQKKNRRLLEAWLAESYRVVCTETAQALSDPFDLGIIDLPTLDRFHENLHARKVADQPAVLPFLLVGSRLEVNRASSYLLHVVDDVILRPFDKTVVQTRVSSLLRMQNISRQLKEQVGLTEKALSEAEQRYQRLFENANDAIATFTLDGTITDVNPGAERLLGWSRAELVGQHVQKVSPPSSVALGEERTRRFLAGEKLPSSIFEAEVIRKDHTVVPIEARTRALRNAQGHPLGFQGIFRDITERKSVEYALRESEKRYRSLFENASDGIATSTLDGIILNMNRGFELMLGWPREEIVGQHYSKFVTPPSAALAEERTRRVLAGEKLPSTFELELMRNDGQTLLTEARARFIRDERGIPSGLQVIYRDITERKRMEIALRESEERFRSLSAASPIGIFYNDVTGACLYTNPRWQEITGMTFEESLASGWAQGVVPEDRAAVLDDWQVCVEKGSEFSHEFRFVRPSGEVRWVHGRAAPIRSETGEVTGYVGTTEDITERKRIEAALQKSHEELEKRVDERTVELVRANTLLRQEISERRQAEEALKLQKALLDQLFESAPESIILLDPQDRVTRVNTEFTRMFGYTPEEAFQQPINSLIVPEELLTEGYGLTRQVHQGEEAGAESIRRRKDGSRLHVSILGAPIRIGGEQIGVYAIYRDISARKQAEEARRESEERYRNLIESTHDLICSVTPDGQFLFVNQSWVQTLGYAEAELAEWNFFAIAHSASLPQCHEAFSKIMEHDPACALQATFVAQDGRAVLVEGSVVGRYRDEQLLSVSGFFRDITERIRLQEQLIERERLAALGRVTGAIAHELGTPLNSVLGYTQLLAQTALPAKAQRRLQIIESQVQRMAEIIQHYLSQARGARLPQQTVDLNPLIQETLGQLELRLRQHHITVQTRLAESLPMLSGDGASLQRVLINLLNNAVDAMRDGGTVTITTRTQPSQDTVKHGVMVEINDTGPGIPPELLPQVFDLFFTTKPGSQGTGLGLAICQEIVKAQGGKIEIQSQPGEGTCVQVFLPADSQPHQSVLAEVKA